MKSVGSRGQGKKREMAMQNRKGRKKTKTENLKNTQIGESSSDDSDIYFYNDIQRWQNKTKVPIWLKKPKDNSSLITFFQNIIRKKLRVNNKERTYKLQNVYLSECLHNIMIYKELNSPIPIQCYAKSPLFKNLFQSKTLRGKGKGEEEKDEKQNEQENKGKKKTENTEKMDEAENIIENEVDDTAEVTNEGVGKMENEKFLATHFLKELKEALAQEKNLKKDMLYEIYSKLIIPGCFFEKNNFCPMFMRLLKFDIYNGCIDKNGKWKNKLEQLVRLLDSFNEGDNVTENYILNSDNKKNETDEKKEENKTHYPSNQPPYNQSPYDYPPYDQHKEDLQFFKSQTSLYKLSQYCIEKNIIQNNEVRSFDTIYIYNGDSDKEDELRNKKRTKQKKNYIYFNEKFEYSLNSEKKNNPSLHFIDSKEKIINSNVKNGEKDKDMKLEKDNGNAQKTFENVLQKFIVNNCDVSKNEMPKKEKKENEKNRKIVVNVDENCSEHEDKNEKKEEEEKKETLIIKSEMEVNEEKKKNVEKLLKPILSQSVTICGKEKENIVYTSDEYASDEREEESDKHLYINNIIIEKGDIDKEEEEVRSDVKLCINIKEIENKNTEKNIMFNTDTDFNCLKDERNPYIASKVKTVMNSSNSFSSLRDYTFFKNGNNEKRDDKTYLSVTETTVKNGKEEETDTTNENNSKKINYENDDAKIKNGNKSELHEMCSNDNFYDTNSTNEERKMNMEDELPISKEETSSYTCFKSCKESETSEVIYDVEKKESASSTKDDVLSYSETKEIEKKTKSYNDNNITDENLNKKNDLFLKIKKKKSNETPQCKSVSKHNDMSASCSDRNIIVIEDDEDMDKNENGIKDKNSSVKGKYSNGKKNSPCSSSDNSKNEKYQNKITETENEKKYDTYAENIKEKTKALSNKKPKLSYDVILIENDDRKLEKDTNQKTCETEKNEIKNSIRNENVNEENNVSEKKSGHDETNVIDMMSWKKLNKAVYDDLFASMDNINSTAQNKGSKKTEENEIEKMGKVKKKELSILNVDLEKADTFVLKKLLDLFGLKNNGLSRKVLVKELKKIQKYLNVTSNTLFQEVTLNVDNDASEKIKNKKEEESGGARKDQEKDEEKNKKKENEKIESIFLLTESVSKENNFKGTDHISSRIDFCSFDSKNWKGEIETEKEVTCNKERDKEYNIADFKDITKKRIFQEKYKKFTVVKNKKAKLGESKKYKRFDEDLYEYDNFLNNDSSKYQDELINELEGRVKKMEQQRLFKTIEEAIYINRDLYKSITVDKQIEYHVLKRYLLDCKVEMKRETLIAYAKENFINLIFKKKKVGHET